MDNSQYHYSNPNSSLQQLQLANSQNRAGAMLNNELQYLSNISANQNAGNASASGNQQAVQSLTSSNGGNGSSGGMN